MRILAALASLTFLFAVSCGGEEDKGTPEAAPVKVSGVHDVACGCSDVVADVTKCGNYVKIDDKYLELTVTGDAKIGDMEFCKQDGVKAEVTGTIEGGKVVATEWKVVK